jgi:hypothetical protein
LKKRCYQGLSGAGLAKEVRESIYGRVIGHLWEGHVNEAVDVVRGIIEQAKKREWVEDLIGYLEAQRVVIPVYKDRQGSGLWITSNRVEKFNDWAVSERGKEHGMSWMPESVISLAAMEAARQNGERDQWWRDQEFPEWEFPEPLRKAG